MPAWLATLVIGGLSLICNLAVTAYYYGRLAQTVADNSKQIDKLGRDRDDVWRTISQIQVDAARITKPSHGD